jgi:hypothetical protein
MDLERAGFAQTGFTHCGFTTYRVDPEHVDAFMATVHSDKLKQMGDEVGAMQSNALLRSMADPTMFVNVTFTHIETPEDLALAQEMGTHPIRLEILEALKPYLLEQPGLEGFQIVSILDYK